MNHSLPLIDIQNVSKEFKTGSKRLKALREVSLSIFPGEIVGLAGESGCGKSTLAKLLVQLNHPTKGQILFDGKDMNKWIYSNPKEFRRQVQMIFQNPSTALNPQMTVEEILGEPFEIHEIASGEEKKALILELLEQVELTAQYCKRLPRELSGGQKQRVAIARALALKPRFLILDEPLSALDFSIQGQIIRLLKDLQVKHGLTYLFISHDLSMMRHFTDRMAIMYLGQIIEMGSSKELWQNPMHPYTKALFSAIPTLDPEWERKRSRIVLQGELPNPFHPPTGCAFHARCPWALPVCKQMQPEWREINGKNGKMGLDHFVSCHLKQST